MSHPEKGVDSTQVPNDFLGELLAVTKEIRDLLRQKTDRENKTDNELNSNSHQSEDPPEVVYLTTEYQALNTEMVTVETDNTDSWPNDGKIAEYRDRCAKYRSECEKMQVELGCFIAHLGIIGGHKKVIEKAESLRKGLLDPVQFLEKALDASPDEGLNVTGDVNSSFIRLEYFLWDFNISPHQNDVHCPHEFEQWWEITVNGCIKIRDLVNGGRFVECFAFIHDVFFPGLNTAMNSVVEALSVFEETSASEWIVTQNIKVFEWWSEKYITCVFSPIESACTSPDPNTIALLKGRIPHIESACVKMRRELDHLIAHYGVVGGDKEVIEAAKLVQTCLIGLVEAVKTAENATSDTRLKAMNSLLSSLGRLYLAAGKFEGSLYHQKHAFYFREVKRWVDCLWNGLHVVHSYMHRNKLDESLTYVCKDLFTNLEVVMFGLSTVPEETKPHLEVLPGTKSGNVAEELKRFGKESLPKFLVDQMERDTTRYVNLTTIATFFSSVTATTLQFTYAASDSIPSNSLRGVVNLFWFLSLVFSVSSAVSSLLGLTWRKSSIYDSRVPPILIRMWLDKGPMLFLVVAAVAFIIGLNLFAYLSLQPRYVSFATNILTGLHGMCLLVATALFIYQLKYESIWAQWFRTIIKPITTIAKWIGTGMKWVWILVKWPYKKYKQNLHLQRNIYWAFEIHNRVVCLNFDIDWDRDWPEPFLLSRLVRRTAYPIKRCCPLTKKALSHLSCSVRTHICVFSRTGDDVEMGKSVRQGEAKAPEEISSESLAKNEFRRSLQTVFSEADRVDDIMGYVGYWERGYEESAEHHIGKCLWGYPALVKKFHEGVRPALIEARERRKSQKESEEQQETITEHVDNRPEGVSEDKEDTTSTPPQSSPPTPSCDRSGPLVFIQSDFKLDNKGQPDGHPPIFDEGSVPIATSTSTEALEPTSRDPVPQPDIREAGTSQDEIEEVTSKLENNSEGPHILQSKEESGE